MYACICRYCQLLGFSEEDVFEELAMVCARLDKHDQAVEICRLVGGVCCISEQLDQFPPSLILYTMLRLVCTGKGLAGQADACNVNT